MHDSPTLARGLCRLPFLLGSLGTGSDGGAAAASWSMACTTPSLAKYRRNTSGSFCMSTSASCRALAATCIMKKSTIRTCTA